MSENNIRQTSAEASLSEYISWEADCREKAALSTIQTLNEICADLGVQYFATGALLDKTASGDALDPSRDTLEVAMFREDFDRFVAYMKSNAQSKGLTFEDAYNKSGTIKKKRVSIRSRNEFHGESSDLNVRVRVFIIPMDTLPDDHSERQAFIESVINETQEYLKKSARMNSYRSSKARSTWISKILNKGKAFFLRGGFHDKYQNQKEDYHKLLTKYSRIDEPHYFARLELSRGPVISAEQILPISKAEFKGTTVFTPHDVEFFSLQTGNEEDNKILNGRIKLLQTFDAFCEEKGIQYVLGWALSNSVIDTSGIDEEIAYGRWDVCLIRDEYERLLDLLGKEQSTLRLMTTERGFPATTSMNAKVVLTSAFNEGSQLMDYPLMINSLDYLPGKYDEGRRLLTTAAAAADRLSEIIAYEKGKKYVRLQAGESSGNASSKLHEICSSCKEKGKQVFTIRKGKVVIKDTELVFPPQRWPFMDGYISVSHDEYCWHYSRDQKYVEYISEKKTALLEKLDTFCTAREIDYFAIASLLIGATIYHDVIPDEINHRWDAAMLRDEYERFLKEIEEHGEQYGIRLMTHYDEGKTIPLARKRVIDAVNPREEVSISIVPFDKVPMDFYLGMGLENMIQEKNEFYKQLIIAKRFPFREQNIPFKGKKLKDCLNYIETADPNAEFEAIDALAQSFNTSDRPCKYEGVCFQRTRAIMEKDIFPLKRELFRGIYINCPKDTSPWQPVINEELTRQVECIQRADLILMKEFDEACKKLGLGYFVCGGTMLGYIRHGGFIPWDDDIDVAMLREDYEKFISQAASVLPENIFLQTRETDKTIPYLFSKIRLNDTEYVTEYSMVREYHQGICLDIFPFDYLPNDKKEREEFLQEINKLAKIHHLVARNQLSPSEEKVVPQNDIERKCMEFEEKTLSSSWGTDLAKTQADYLAVATRYNDRAEKEGLTTVGSFVPSYTYIDIKDLLPYQRGIFEGVEVSVPKRPDIFLEMQYGDYMELPPEHKRIAHRLVRWKTAEGSGGIELEE